MRLHATCVAIDGRGVLLTGPAGTGKSDLALRLIDRGARLVSDDGVEIARVGDRLLGSAPSTIAGKLEVRGIGIVAFDTVSDVPLALCVALDALPARMPPEVAPCRNIEGIDLPLIALAPLESSAPIKIEQALIRWGLTA